MQICCLVQNRFAMLAENDVCTLLFLLELVVYAVKKILWNLKVHEMYWESKNFFIQVIYDCIFFFFSNLDVQNSRSGHFKSFIIRFPKKTGSIINLFYENNIVHIAGKVIVVEVSDKCLRLLWPKLIEIFRRV